MLKASNIHKSYQQYENQLHVLKGIDLEVQKGDVLAIVGPSGAGKSTLLHILGGLDKPSEGTVLLDGQDIYKLNDTKLARIRNEEIGFIFQFYHLLSEFNALENIILPAMIKANQDRADSLKSKGLELLNIVGLGQRAKHKPNQLSGGEQQRVAIARALMNEPKIIFCDEPTGNLDSETGREIVELLFKLNKENNQTFVIVTHDEHIANTAQTSIHLTDGQITPESQTTLKN